MQTSSSISNSEVESAGPARSSFARRLAMFIAPYAVIIIAMAGLGTLTGEFLPARTAAWLQSFGVPALYLPKLSDHSFAYKMAGAQIHAPEILAIGASRANQWRSAMFETGFYNAAQAVYTFKDYTQFLKGLGETSPRVIIASIDFYNFNAGWDGLFTGSQKSDLNPLDIQQLPFLGLINELRGNPLSVFDYREPLYGIPAIGLSAQRMGAGFRSDGSFQYGAEISGDFAKSFTIEQAFERVAKGTAPLLFGDGMDASGFDDLADFLDLAKSRKNSGHRRDNAIRSPSRCCVGSLA